MASDQINLEFLRELKRKDQRSVIDFCIDMKLIASGFECQTCKLPMTLCVQNEETDGFLWSCLEPGGSHEYRTRSVKSDSWFDGTKLPVIDMLICIYLWVSDIKSKHISDELRVPRIEIYKLISRCRDVCVEILLNESVVLGGPGVIVDIYEAKVLKYKSNKSQITDGWVFLVSERGTNKCFVQVNENREKSVLLNILHTRVFPGTKIICECWNTYCSFEEKINLGMNNNLLIMDVEPGGRERFWALINYFVYGRRSRDQFDCYVAEFMWRNFHQRDYQALFGSFLRNISFENCQRKEISGC